MKHILFFIMVIGCFSAFSQSRLVKNLAAGKDQVVVVYGTSLSSGGHGESWMGEVSRYMNEKYGNHLTFCLAGEGGKWSTWGVQHLENNVIAKKPDVVIMEFGINDAVDRYNMSPELVRLNLKYMIDRIRLSNPSCEIILQVMNMAIGQSAATRPNLVDIYNVYRKVAKKEKLLLIDHYSNWQKILDQGEQAFLKYVTDGLHPNGEGGRKIIAPEIIKCLEGK